MEAILLKVINRNKPILASFLVLAIEISDRDCSLAIDKQLELEMP